MMYEVLRRVLSQGWWAGENTMFVRMFVRSNQSDWLVFSIEVSPYGQRANAQIWAFVLLF